jgi:hypothetical protein
LKQKDAKRQMDRSKKSSWLLTKKETV